MDHLTTTVVITTKNRKDELAKAIDSCLRLSGNPEVLVFDDGSTDQTFEYVRERYGSVPAVTLHREEVSLGLINARTKAAGIARGEIIVSIDDDCVFDHTETLTEILGYFSDERIAAVSIPAIDVLKNPDVVTQQAVGRPDEVFILPQYRGCAHAIRKEVFLKVGGYRQDLIRQEEETDMAIRLYKNKYYIRVGACTKPILHYHSAVRNEQMITFYQARNKCMLAYVHAPRLLPLLEVGRIMVSMSLYAYRKKNLKSGIDGIRDALKNILSGKLKREPQSLSTLVFYKNLRRKGVAKITL